MAWLVLAAVLALSGCVAGDGYPILQREATAADQLPPEFDEEFDDFDLESARLSARFEGAGLYILRRLTGEVCLAVAFGDASGIACGAAGTLGMTVPGLPPFEMGPEPIGEKDGWTVLSDNIRVAQG